MAANVELAGRRRCMELVSSELAGATAARATYRWGGITRSSSLCVLARASIVEARRFGGAAVMGGRRGIGGRRDGGKAQWREFFYHPDE